MEKGRILQRQQLFHERFDNLDADLKALEAALSTPSASTATAPSPSSSSSTLIDDSTNSNTGTSNGDKTTTGKRLQHQIMRLHYEIADLCGQHQEYKLATVYYHKVLDWLNARETKIKSSGNGSRPLANAALARAASKTTSGESPVPNQLPTDATSILSPTERALKENVLNNLSTMYFGAGDSVQAMECLLDAKKLSRAPQSEQLDRTKSSSGDDNGDSVASSQKQLDKVLTANYALFLHAKGNIDDAIHAAASVIEVTLTSQGKEDEEEGVDTIRAKITALSLLSSCWKGKGEDEQAMEFAKQAARLADEIQDSTLQSRTHNNLALLCFERREFSTALHHLLTAFRATNEIQDFQHQAVVKYHLGLVLSKLETSVELPESSRTLDNSALQRSPAAVGSGEDTAAAKEEDSNGSNTVRHSSSKKLIPDQALTTAKDCFLHTETLVGVLPRQDPVLQVLAHGCRGEAEYYAGEFHTAEAEFSIALQRLQEILYPEQHEVKAGSTTTTTSKTTSIQTIQATEVIKIQGFLLSYMGCTQLVEGKFELAKESHQCDLEMALKHEDIHAQLRAMRNLALVYNSTQRYHDAIPLWCEALEIASVLQSKADQMMAYSGLGIAMKELRVTDQKGEFKDLLNIKENNPLHIFLRQRALAIELGDKNQQIIAQRHVVSTYESPDSSIDIEQRLAECDTLVRLCEQYENLQYRGDAYRSLANALTAQMARLSARGARFAEAVNVLTQKRNSVCAKYQGTTKTLKAATAAMILVANDDDMNTLELKKLHQEDKHPRPPVTRVDILQRR